MIGWTAAICREEFFCEEKVCGRCIYRTYLASVVQLAFYDGSGELTFKGGVNREEHAPGDLSEQPPLAFAEHTLHFHTHNLLQSGAALPIVLHDERVRYGWKAVVAVHLLWHQRKALCANCRSVHTHTHMHQNAEVCSNSW